MKRFHQHHLTRIRRRRGHTVVEVVVAIFLSGGLLTVLGYWLVGMVGSASQGSDVALFHSDMMVTKATLANDLRNSTACNTVTPAVVSATPTELRLWTAPTWENPYSRVLVTWRVVDGFLVRTAQPTTGTIDTDACVVPAPPEDASQWVTYLGAVTVPEGGGFYTYNDTTRSTVGGDTAADQRIVPAVGVELDVTTPQGLAVVPFVAAGEVNNTNLAITN